GRMCKCDAAGRLGQRREVIRQPHDLERLDECRSRGKIAQPPGRKGEGLRHGSADREARIMRKQLERARRATTCELVVGLIHDDYPRGHITDGPNCRQTDRSACGIVWAGDQHYSRASFEDHLSCRIWINGEVVATWDGARLAVGVA